jgi:hypothetical protein
MEPAQISYYFINETSDSVINGEYYSGSYGMDQETVTFKLQIWNNRYAQTTVETIAQPVLVINFGTYEDSKLFDAMTVYVDDSSVSSELQILDQKAYVYIDRALAGISNNGLASNTQNYCTVKIEFDIKDKKLKTGLKQLYLDLQYSR